MAATDFHINGPSKVVVFLGGAEGAYADLGYTDNDDLIRFTATDHRKLLTRTDSGDMISQVVYSGTTATIDMTLVSWDEAVLTRMLAKLRTGDDLFGSAFFQGEFSSVGSVARTVADLERFVTIGIVGAVDANWYYFDVILNSGPEYIDFGNAAKRIAMSFITIYDGGANGRFMQVYPPTPTP